LLTLHLRDPFYSRLRSIVVYPHTYVPQSAAGVHSMTLQPKEETSRLGESWQHGAVVLSWDSARRDVADFHDGKNVVLHEFAHQLDQEHEGADGVPVLPNSSAYRAWGRVMREDFLELREAVEDGERTVMNRYGATNPAEFFAVATECFFEKAEVLRRRHPELYEELKGYYGQDPAGAGPVPEGGTPAGSAA
jgi:Mlc titration factor MtfA (ptsG expression regulator)